MKAVVLLGPLLTPGASPGAVRNTARRLGLARGDFKNGKPAQATV